jgi:hypothetical protein
MELKDFIKETLKDIITDIKKVQDGIIVPVGYQTEIKLL